MQKNISNDISLFYSTQVKLYENGWSYYIPKNQLI